MIYFDNAATGGFKPYSVTEAVNNVTRYLCANPTRSGHRLANASAKIVNDARHTFSTTFNNGDESRVVFTKSCTEALNLAIIGGIKEGSTVMTTVFEHNSVLRPLYHLEEQGKIKLIIAQPTAEESLEEYIINHLQGVDYLVMTGASNLTGQTFDIKSVGKACKKQGVTFIVDGAQAGGHIKIDMKECNVNALCLSGHKGLYGIMGSGVLIFDERIEIKPIIYGGTGIDSFNQDMPENYPERLEGGTLPFPSIVALYEGIIYVNENIEYFGKALEIMTGTLINKLKALSVCEIYSKPNKTGVVAFNLQGMDSIEVGNILSDRYDIAVRCGYHCAPLLHKYLDTYNTGAIRVGLAPNNTMREINTLITALKEIIAER